MNVYSNSVNCDYGEGIILIAAHSIKEAIHIYKNCEFFHYDFLEIWKMKEEEFLKLEDSQKHSKKYMDENWKLVKGLSYDGDPCLITEYSHEGEKE